MEGRTGFERRCGLKKDRIDALERALDRFPQVAVAHVPTPLESLGNLGRELGLALHVKRDDCTGLAFGGNKVRQLEFYFGAALDRGADTVLITGAVQSNYVRTTAAMAGRFGMACHIQLEERVPDADALHRSSGNVLLDRLMGATIHRYPEGEDEDGADANLSRIAEGLEAQGRRPYIIPLSPKSPPLGALGYVRAAIELAEQIDVGGIAIDEIIVPSGSAFTHAGLLVGLRALGLGIPITGICVRRDAARQTKRVTERVRAIGEMLEIPAACDPDDIRLFDGTLAPGYGQLNPQVIEAIGLAARCEGLFLDPVYSGKAMAGLIALARAGALAGPNALFVHTGGQPALFAYGESLLPAAGSELG